MGLKSIGINDIYGNIIAILSISELGIAGAITYNLYKPIMEKNTAMIATIVRFYKKCYRIIGCLILVLSFILSFFVHTLIKDATVTHQFIQITFFLYAINTSFSYFFSYNRSLFYAYQENYYTIIIDFIFKVIKNILQITALILWKNYIIFLLMNIICTYTNNIVVYVLAKRRYKSIDLKNAKNDKMLEKKIIKDVKSLAGIQIMSTLINFTDSIIISRFVGIIITGLYANYKMIITQLTNVINTIFNGVGASLGNLIAEGNENRIKKILFNMESFCFILGSFCLCSLIYLFNPFIEIWLGRNYIMGIEIVIIISINFYLVVQRQVINYYLRTGGHHAKMIRPLGIEAVINLILSIVLAMKIGLLGVLIGTTCSALYGLIRNSKLLYNIYNIDYRKYIYRHIKYSVIVILELFIIYVATNILLTNNNDILLDILLLAFIICVVSAIIDFIILFKDKDAEYMKEIMMSIAKKIIRKGKKNNVKEN